MTEITLKDLDADLLVEFPDGRTERCFSRLNPSADACVLRLAKPALFPAKEDFGRRLTP